MFFAKPFIWLWFYSRKTLKYNVIMNNKTFAEVDVLAPFCLCFRLAVAVAYYHQCNTLFRIRVFCRTAIVFVQR